ncbi:nucleolus and neural progenitor protein-like [Osmia bicornis bicornis]|uniref:nucleolus and neural progenitor protein-like n=1 Tax=Osmia bicornis bicornis TaxID=1437191 RepID=UPI0010F84A7A|nr:nucleolus and neural progenitor protein-like [Osmia bicornis bicornis]
MEVIWNHIQLERPPNVTCHVRRKKFDATAFLTTLEKVINDLTSQDLLHKEAAILSRIIYRMKTKFRNDKGVKSMLKVNKVLLNYLSLQLKKEYENLKSFVEINNTYVILPSKQMVEYVLVRTQGFAKLMLRLEEVSKHSAHYLKSRMGIGHAWIIAIIAYAVVSRIWLLSRHLVKQSCTWYNDLYGYLKSFNISGVSWLPDNYELPSDLKLWLSVPWIDEPIPSVPSSYGLQSSMFKLIIPHEYDSDEDASFNIQYNTEKTNPENESLLVEKENVTSSVVPMSENKSIVPDVDTGEVIDRRTFYNLNHQKKDFKTVNDKDTSPKQQKNFRKKKSVEKLLTFDNVKIKSDLVTLLNRESYPGLDKLQWNIIRNKGKKLLNKLDSCSTESKQAVLLKKITKRIQSWIT